MTPKEKALSLIEKFDNLLPCEGTTTGHTPIECALVTVDEMIKFALYGLNSEQIHKEDKLISYQKSTDLPAYNYWVKVKTELFTMLANF